MTGSDLMFQTTSLKPEADYHAPDGSEIRLLPTVKGGGLCHCTLPAGRTSSPVAHHSVEEIWYVVEGQGEVWRRAGETEDTVRYVVEGQGEVWRRAGETEDTVRVSVGTSLTISPRTAFQFRNTGPGPLCILIVTMPPWPGPQEAAEAVGVWPAVAASPSAETVVDEEIGGEG